MHSSKVRLSWSELGAPSTPQILSVRGVGDVRIDQSWIDRARAAGGDPAVELIDVTSHDTFPAGRAYIIGSMLP